MSNNPLKDILCVRCGVEFATKLIPIHVPRNKAHYGKGGLFNTQIMDKAVVPTCTKCHTVLLKNPKTERKHIKVKSGGLVVKPETSKKWISLKRWVFAKETIKE